MNQQIIPGPFTIDASDARLWRIDGDAGLVIWLGAPPEGLGSAPTDPRSLTIDWDADGCLVRWFGPASRESRARAVWVQRARPDVYAALPLARGDERARRFWRRVFLIARLPGGGTLLRLLARRARA